MPADFDIHDNVRYHSITHLYWGKYPYKIVVETDKSWHGYKTYTHARSAAAKMFKQLKFPKNAEYKVRQDGIKFSIFFLDRSAAIDFVDKNIKRVKDAWRPINVEDIDRLADKKVRIRSKFFFDHYEWVVRFNCRNYWVSNNDPRSAECDDWVENFFCMQRETIYNSYARSERALYSYSTRRSLYLTNETDVIAAKIALSEYVDSIEQAVISTEPIGEKNITETE